MACRQWPAEGRTSNLYPWKPLRLSATRLVISISSYRSGIVLLVLAAALTLLAAAAVAFGVDARPGPRDMLHDWRWFPARGAGTT